jgi:23S rRNA pseudouridine2605 synthase
MNPTKNSTDSQEMRLNKAIAATGFCSRRAADSLIFAGRVSVNNQQETNPARQVRNNDAIAVDGKLLQMPQKYIYLMLNKPPQVVCTAHDPEQRETVLDYLPQSVRDVRLYPVGRLDYFSEGLLLLTNDGGLTQYLTHPRHHQAKTYEVLVRGAVTEMALAVMRKGMFLQEGEKLLPVEVEILRANEYETLMRMVLKQGVNRQIRRMCRDLELTILRLRRVSQGMLALNALETGKTRFLSADEVSALKKGITL